MKKLHPPGTLFTFDNFTAIVMYGTESGRGFMVIYCFLEKVVPIAEDAINVQSRDVVLSP